MTNALRKAQSYPKRIWHSGNKIWCFLACALLLTQGCLASTNMASVRNPAWAPRSIDSMLIWVESGDLNVRREMEDEFEAKGWEYDIEIVPALDLFFPGNSYSEDEVSEALGRREITVILHLVPGASGTQVTQRPTTTTTGCSIWTSSQGCVQATSTTSSGSVSRGYAEHSLSLIDVVDQNTIWTASAATGGNAYAGRGTLRKSLVGKTLEQLIRDGVL